MNWKRFFIAFIATFIFIFLFGYAWFGTLMQNIHNEVPALWRTQADFGSHFSWLILGHVVIAFFLVVLYARFVSAGGVGAGFGLGLVVAFLYVGDNLITFAVQPITTKIVCGWIVGNLIQFAIAGAIVGAIYKPAQNSSLK